MYGAAVQFLLAEQEQGVVRSQMKEWVQYLETRVSIQVQLAATVEFGRPFVQDTYRSEGDGPLCLRAYEENSTLKPFVSNERVGSTSCENRVSCASVCAC